MIIETGNIGGILNYRLESDTDGFSMSTLVQRLDEYYIRFHLHPRYVLANTNKPLTRYSMVEDFMGANGVVLVNAFVSVPGGKGGFGANLRANKSRSGKQPKRETKGSKTYYKDLKTGVKTRDINTLKKAYDALNGQDENAEKEMERLQQKKEKLQKAIVYYESVLDGSVASNERFSNTMFLEELDDVMVEVREGVRDALNLESECDGWESDWESSGDDQVETQEGSSKDQDTGKKESAKAKPKPKFASFFDEDDEE